MSGKENDFKLQMKYFELKINYLDNTHKLKLYVEDQIKRCNNPKSSK